MSITPTSGIEMEEYMVAVTLANQTGLPVEEPKYAELVTKCRVALRHHRIVTLTWALNHGVALPLTLLSDQLHKFPGDQTPDLLSVPNALPEDPAAKTAPPLATPAKALRIAPDPVVAAGPRAAPAGSPTGSESTATPSGNGTKT